MGTHAHPYTQIHSLSIQHTCTHTNTHSEQAEDFTLVYQTITINFKNKNWGTKLTKNMFEPYLNGSGCWMDMHKIVNKIYNMHNMPSHYIPKQA